MKAISHYRGRFKHHFLSVLPDATQESGSPSDVFGSLVVRSVLPKSSLRQHWAELRSRYYEEFGGVSSGLAQEVCAAVTHAVGVGVGGRRE